MFHFALDIIIQNERHGIAISVTRANYFGIIMKSLLSWRRDTYVRKNDCKSITCRVDLSTFMQVRKHECVCVCVCVYEDESLVHKNVLRYKQVHV